MVDTLGVVEDLEKGGFSESQAKAVAGVLRDRLVGGGSLVTKADLTDLKASLVMWFAGIMIGQTLAILGGVFAMLRTLQP